MIIGDAVAGRIEDKRGTERYRFFPWVLVGVCEKAPQKLAERGAARHGGHKTAITLYVALLLHGGLLVQLDRNIDDGRQHVLGERREARQRNGSLVVGLLG